MAAKAQAATQSAAHSVAFPSATAGAGAALEREILRGSIPIEVSLAAESCAAPASAAPPLCFLFVSRFDFFFERWTAYVRDFFAKWLAPALGERREVVLLWCGKRLDPRAPVGVLFDAAGAAAGLAPVPRYCGTCGGASTDGALLPWRLIALLAPVTVLAEEPAPLTDASPAPAAYPPSWQYYHNAVKQALCVLHGHVRVMASLQTADQVRWAHALARGDVSRVLRHLRRAADAQPRGRRVPLRVVLAGELRLGHLAAAAAADSPEAWVERYAGPGLHASLEAVCQGIAVTAADFAGCTMGDLHSCLMSADGFLHIVLRAKEGAVAETAAQLHA